MQKLATLYTMNRLLARFGLVAAAVFLLAVTDAFISGYRESKTTFRALPGVSQAVSGTLDMSVDNLDALSFTSQSSAVRVDFTRVQGRLWFGTLKVSPEARPGHYTFQVLPVARAEKEPPPYQVWVFENDKALKATYKSFVRRIFGFGPIWMVFMTLPLVAASLGGSYYLSSRQEDHLAENGIVPIIRMARCKHGWEVDFALGSRDGLSARDELLVLNSHFEKAGRITVDQVHETHSRARVPADSNIQPSYWLLRAPR